MDLKQTLQGIELFEGLSDSDLEQVIRICTEQRFHKGATIAKEGEVGNEMFVITDGFADVLLGERSNSSHRVVVSLGSGQIIGEMSLLDQGPRSASIRATSDPTVVQVIKREDFDTLCQKNTRIGYTVMRNLAVDLSFKLRHRNLSER
jgi:CRP/FNR family transcriptional regulator, cyclic AMP receptor protein